MNKMACAPIVDSDQPGRLPSQISLHCPHEESLGPYLPIEQTAKTLISLGIPGWSESLLIRPVWSVFAGRTATLLVLSQGGSFELQLSAWQNPTKRPVGPAKTRISLGFAVRMEKSWVLSYPLSAQRRLIRLGKWLNAQADLSLPWVDMPFCRFCHASAHSLQSWI